VVVEKEKVLRIFMPAKPVGIAGDFFPVTSGDVGRYQLSPLIKPILLNVHNGFGIGKT
jgi:hypothetical protein